MIHETTQREHGTPLSGSSPTGLTRCIANTCLALLPLAVLPLLFRLPYSFVLSDALVPVFYLLLLSIPTVFVTALFLLFKRVHYLFTQRSGVALRHVVSVGAVVAAYMAFICQVLLPLGQILPDLSGLRY